MKKPLVSIIIPVYNGEKYIKRCVNSALNQTYENIEVLVINDWSSDNTLNILNDLVETDTRIRIFSHKNHGVWYSRNIWIDSAKWEYITFMDVDDFVKDDFIEKFINTVRANDYDVVIWWYIKYRPNYEKIIQINDNSIWKYFNGQPRWKFFNRSFLLNNDIKFLDRYPWEDVYFSILTYNKTNKIWIILSKTK